MEVHEAPLIDCQDCQHPTEKHSQREGDGCSECPCPRFFVALAPPLVDRLMADPEVYVTGSTAGGWTAHGYGQVGRGPSIRAAVAQLAERLR